MSTHLWDHYEYGGDLGFLRERAYPMLRENALFLLDYLTEAPTGTPYAGKLPIDLVTVGSPLTHLYQHYFPAHYPANDPKCALLQKFVPQWRNVFRTDDFVGTFVTFGSSNPQTQTWPQNTSAKPGGHTEYWQRDIFEDLADFVP